ncbi:DUF3048 domain-containing protein [Candidatus Gottesmanbacteria bacterium]|nr:DUF3048 domain-containing protein [Candidatus Gottesmanbacteria bacterium]
MKKLTQPLVILIGIGLFLLSTGVSFAAFSFFQKGSTNSTSIPSLGGTSEKKPTKKFSIDPSIPRTALCPLNGDKYTEQEKVIWEKRRPLAVMIENHEEARPQSGLSYADIIYESVVEGGTTRFMGIFYCGSAAFNIGLAPVRSARTYFLPWVLEYDAFYNHVGGAGNCNDPTVDERAKALCQIDQYRIKDMDQFGISFPTCYRNYDRLDHEVATEHTMVCFTDKLHVLGEKRGWTAIDDNEVRWDKNFVPWKFKEDAKESDRGASFSASFSGWKSMEKGYGVKWVYDKPTNVYKRFNGGVAHFDFESKEQLTAKVVIILFAKETGPVDEHGHLLYANIGSGDGFVYQDGKAIKMTWKKPLRTSRTQFFDKNGEEILLNPGKIWIHMLPTGTPITVE